LIVLQLLTIDKMIKHYDKPDAELTVNDFSIYYQRVHDADIIYYQNPHGRRYVLKCRWSKEDAINRLPNILSRAIFKEDKI